MKVVGCHKKSCFFCVPSSALEAVLESASLLGKQQKPGPTKWKFLRRGIDNLGTENSDVFLCFIFGQLMVNCWFGLMVWIPGIPL